MKMSQPKKFNLSAASDKNAFEQYDLNSATDEDSLSHLLFGKEDETIKPEPNALDDLFVEKSQIDPLIEPFIDAAEQLKISIEAQAQANIDTIKRETAEQTKEIYQKLTEARNEFKHLELKLSDKTEEVNSLLTTKTELENQNQDILSVNQAQQQQITTLQAELKHLKQNLDNEITVINEKNETLIDRLRKKIDQINDDYAQQITNLQQKLAYQESQLNSEITELVEENESLRNKLSTHQEISTSSSALQQEIDTLRDENTAVSNTLKEKAEKLLRSEHTLKLAHDELRRSQQYIKELEENNNKIQKELFENWISKTENL